MLKNGCGNLRSTSSSRYVHCSEGLYVLKEECIEQTLSVKTKPHHSRYIYSHANIRWDMDTSPFMWLAFVVLLAEKGKKNVFTSAMQHLHVNLKIINELVKSAICR